MTAAAAAQKRAGRQGGWRARDSGGNYGGRPSGSVRAEGGLTVEAVDEGSPQRAGYRRSAGTPRGEARRRELLDRVVDDLAVNGLVDFSLRRAARAAGTTHKVLLYYFDGAYDLLGQAIVRLRDRRIGNALAAASQGPPGRTMADRIRAVWPVLMNDEL